MNTDSQNLKGESRYELSPDSGLRNSFVICHSAFVILWLLTLTLAFDGFAAPATPFECQTPPVQQNRIDELVLTRLEKLLYLVLVAVSNQDGVSFYSDARLGELLDIRFPHELEGARRELVARDLIAYEDGIYQVLDLPADSPRKPRECSPKPPDQALRSNTSLPRLRKNAVRDAAADLESIKQLLERCGWGRT